MEKIPNKEFWKFQRKVGGTNQAAELLGISPLTVGAYRRGERKVPPDIALAIWRLSKKRLGPKSVLGLIFPDEKF